MVKNVRSGGEAGEESPADADSLFLLVWMDELGAYQDDGELEPEA